MADRARAVAGAPGEFFVDDSCIDCDTCRRIAPTVFVDAGGWSTVGAQPADEHGRRWAARAALSCPTNSIGASGAGRAAIAAAVDDFPLHRDAARARGADRALLSGVHVRGLVPTAREPKPRFDVSGSRPCRA